MTPTFLKETSYMGETQKRRQNHFYLLFCFSVPSQTLTCVVLGCPEQKHSQIMTTGLLLLTLLPTKTEVFSIKAEASAYLCFS